MSKYVFLCDRVLVGENVKTVEKGDLVLERSPDGMTRVIKNGVDLIKGLNQLKEECFSLVLYSDLSKKKQLHLLTQLSKACGSAGLGFPFSSPTVIAVYDPQLSNVFSNDPKITQEGDVTIALWGAHHQNDRISLRRALESKGALNIKPQDRGAHYVIDWRASGAIKEGYKVYLYIPYKLNKDVITFIEEIISKPSLKDYLQQDSFEHTISSKQNYFWASREELDYLEDLPVSSDATKVVVTWDENHAFDSAKSELERFLREHSSLKSPLFNSAKLVLTAVEAEAKNLGLRYYHEKTTAELEQFNTLTEVLKTTYILLAKEYLPADEDGFINDYDYLLGVVNGQTSGGKIIAGAMIAFLSLIILSLAVTAAVASFGTVPALMTTTLLIGGAGVAAQGISISIATLALFTGFAGAALAYSGREKGVAAATHQFYKTLKSSSSDEHIEQQDGPQPENPIF